MNITRYGSAPRYHPPKHEGMSCLRLQGHEAGPSSDLWLGLSHLLPGGGTTLDASGVEKMYVVLDGEVTIRTGEDECVLQRFDSVRLAPGEQRQLINNTNQPASILLAMPYTAPT
ncbi:cupin domain-containing protein [Massilia niastensis]|uniref:cupin domain-containing protein n=1 Tax=Massilia niastensis TaxID=544911 RepID=UPI000378D47C|nr:cupin domain-containing protein [Massilia niastensis]